MPGARGFPIPSPPKPALGILAGVPVLDGTGECIGGDVGIPAALLTRLLPLSFALAVHGAAGSGRDVGGR